MYHNRYLYNLATDKAKGIRAGVLKAVLLVLSLVYGLLIRVARSLQKLCAVRLDCTVISVGNITVGGTGKTALVQTIARFLKSQGHVVCVLSRGFRKGGGNECPATACETMGDEPCMISENMPDIPVLVSPDRVSAAIRAIRQFKADTIILDDGFQQWRLRKDLEVVTVDASNPFGNRHMLPRGLLRQPLSTLAEADVFVMTNSYEPRVSSDLRTSLVRINPRAVIVEATHTASEYYPLADRRRALSVEALQGKSVVAFCGIGNPDSFKWTLENIGVSIAGWFSFPDHHPYTGEDIESLMHPHGGQAPSMLVTTQKDAVRIPAGVREKYGRQIFVIAVDLDFKDEKKRFFDRLLRVYPV
ncbi:MAG: tetraacyldisaccharide 4'-kinase [Candidatus Omnitrophica bacterium]|nr:tetraacyldisaccharide 4'-kinase [Candidatus Omnitrophota bacterium]